MTLLLWNIPVLAAFLFLFSGTLAWIVANWFDYQGSHGPVILAISLYMVWAKRSMLRSIDMKPSLAMGLPILIAGCFMLIAGRVSGVLLMEYLSLIVVLLGLVAVLLGTGHLKLLWVPIVYLLFMFPIFSEALESISIHLQNAAAWIAFNLLDLGGITVSRDSQFLRLPNITLEVARECNGINHIMALVSLAVPLAYWTQRTLVKRAVLIIAAFAAGVIANGLRVAIIGFLSVYNPGGPVHGPYDLFYVSFIFFFGMIVISALALLMSRGEAKTDEAAVEPSTTSRQHGSGQRGLKHLVAAALILAASGAYLFSYKAEPVALQYPLAFFPYRVGDWTGQDSPLSEEPFTYFSADAEVKRVYRDGFAGEASVYIGYFKSQAQDREIVNYRFDPLQAGAVPVKVQIDGAGELTITVQEKKGRRAYFWYDIDGRIATDRYRAKMMTLINSLTKRRSNAAIIVIVTGDKTPIDSGKLLNAFFPVIRNHLRSEP